MKLRIRYGFLLLSLLDTIFDFVAYFCRWILLWILCLFIRFRLAFYQMLFYGTLNANAFQRSLCFALFLLQFVSHLLLLPLWSLIFTILAVAFYFYWRWFHLDLLGLTFNILNCDLISFFYILLSWIILLHLIRFRTSHFIYNNVFNDNQFSS